MDKRYEPCNQCDKKTLKKAIPIKRQLDITKVDQNFKRCPICNKRHIDYVMAHVLKIMIENEYLSSNSSIRKVGTPLITPAIFLKSSPYLPANSLVLIIKDIDENTATAIYESVPEIKGIIKGDINKTVGQVTDKSMIHNYELLAGCDVRCDIQQTPTGNICLLKPQSKIHIEYPKEQSPKIMDVDTILDKYDKPTVLDALCGAGTLGIYALTKNAQKVHFNDVYDVAVDTTHTNLKLNNIPSSRYTISNENINQLVDTIDEKFDVGLIDAFPNVDIQEFKSSLKKVCKDVYVI